MALDLLQEQFYGTVAHLEEDVHAGQCRFLHGAFRTVVKADDRDILRDLRRCCGGPAAPKPICRCWPGPQGIRARPMIWVHRRFASVIGVMAVDYQALVGVQPMLCQRRAVGSQTGASVTRHVVLAARDEGDAPVTVLDQMSHRRQDASRYRRRASGHLRRSQ